MTELNNSLLLRGGMVFDEHAQLLPDHAILIDGARIVRIAPASEFIGYSGSAIDLSGCSLLPGLIDCHVHLLYGGESDPATVINKMRPGDVVIRAMEHAGKTLRSGITAVRDCGGKDYLEFSVRDACNQGRFSGPTIRAAGRIICMTGGHGNQFGRVADGSPEVIKAVREQVHAGCDLIKLMATGGVMTKGVNPQDAHYSAEELAIGINEAKRFSRTTASHAQGTEGILNATRGGVTSIEHGIFMNDECIGEMLERGTFLVPTLSAPINIIDHHDRGIPQYIIDKAKICAEAHRKSVKAFYDAGGKIAMGTDAGTPFNHHGENVQELNFMTEIGMSEGDAILSSTRVAAELMQLHERGAIKQGYFADLIAVKGNPLTDITAISNHENLHLVIKNGQIVGEKNLVQTESQTQFR